MKVELWPLEKIRPYKGNPRRNEPAVDAVAKSIERFGFRQPIVVDKKGVIVAGDTRYRAALKLELKKAPVHVAADLTPQQARAYRLADNKTGELAKWDHELLRVELGDLAKADADLGGLGFDAEELARIVAGDAAADETGKDPGEGGYKEQYGVIVMCSSEAHQKKVFKQLTDAGHECRVVTT